MTNVLDRIPKMSQTDLNALRNNAMRILEKEKEIGKINYAEQVLNAIDHELERRYLPGMIKTFLEVYPGGFYGEKQAVEERDYKLAACTAFQKLLSQTEFEDLKKIENYDELWKRVSTLVGMTNFIQARFEKPQLLDKIKSPDYSAPFFNALFNVLYSDRSLQDRFASWSDELEDMGLAKWTYATYFLFLKDPVNAMFVKPEMLKKSLDLCKYPLEYESKPSAALYLKIIEFSRWLKLRIHTLNPRDMVDVHSFMWHMAPTGKWSADN